MTAVSPVPHEPDLERPSPAAQLKITARKLGSAEGIVPPGAAKHLITAFGISGCALAGIAGAVLTLRIAPGLTTPALAELALALLSALLIAVGGWVPDGGGIKPPSDPKREE